MMADGSVTGSPPKLLASLQAFYPQVTWVNDTYVYTAPPGQRAPAWGVGVSGPFVPPPGVASLAPAVRVANLDPTQLLPGAFAAFTWPDGAPYAVATGVMPLAVQYSTAAFAAAGLPPPGTKWTLADFGAACAALAGAARAQKLPKPIRWVLAPLAGQTAIPLGGGRTTLWRGGLSDPALWAAFAIGFGGTIVDHGRFDLTGTKTVQGIGALVELARQFSGGAGAVPKTPAEVQALVVQHAFAMDFTMYTARTTPPPGYRWARFPRLPVRAVIPVTPEGYGLAHTSGVFGRSSMTYAKQYKAPEWALEATVAFARWIYSLNRGQSKIPGISLRPPVLADAAVQNAYWASPPQATHGSGAVGDWGNFEVVQADWPRSGRGGPVSRTADIALTGLTKAVFDGAPVPGVLAEITQQLNAAAAQYAGSAGG